jgi:hypothetical protein
MRNSALSRTLVLLFSVLSLSSISSQAQFAPFLVWTCGIDDDAWPLTGTAGGAAANFVQENGAISPLPGSPNSTPVAQGADNDYYFAGSYTTVIPGNGAYAPIGAVAANENSAERAFAAADNDLRYHFNLPASLRPFDLLSVTFDALNLHDGQADTRYGIEVYFNGVLVQTQIVIRAAQLGTDFTTPKFSLASVNAQAGPGFDNIVSLRGINYNGDGGGNWMGIDYVQLNASPGAGLLPNVVNIGGNKIGSATDNPDNSITIVGGGNDIWDQRDEFTYKYTEMTGDFDVQVRVESLTPNARWSKAGIMVRESLSEFSRMVFPRVTPPDVPTLNGGNGANDVVLAYRTGLDNVNGANGGQHEDGPIPYIPAGATHSNAWLRLIRTGAVFTGQASSNGVDWVTLSSQNTATWGGGALSNHVFLGLGVGRHSGGPTATANFRDFKFNTNNLATFDVVGASSRGNPTGVRVTFNNPLGAGAFNAANYTLGVGTGPNVTVVTGLRFTTANDAIERDPMTFTLEGSMDPAGPWTLIASGNTGLDTARFATAPDVLFANSTAWRSYRLLFPTVRNAAGANSMQIAEVAFLDAGGNDVTAPGDPVIPTSGNSPGAEISPNAIDNNSATKYLNFDKLNTGFTVTPSGGGLPADPTVISAVAGTDPNTVQLTTTPLVEGVDYTLTIANVQRADGASLNNSTVSFVHGAGYEARRIVITHNKTDDSGYYPSSDAVAKGIGDVTAMSPGAPVPFYPPVQSNTVFEDPIPDIGDPNGNERFSSRISGVLVAPTTGNYTFFMSSDDVGYLYLSSDENPANKVQIAREPSWNGRRQYIAGGNQVTRGTPPANIASNIVLQAGGRYYLELIFTEGGGGNNGSAAWQPPGGPAVANDSSPIPEANFTPTRLFGGNIFRTLGPIRIVSQPANQSVTALTPATFRVGLDGTPGYTYQWRRNGQPIAGATGPTYTIQSTQPSDDQAVFSVVAANEFSTVTSSGGTLTVLTPVPPHLLGANADASFTSVLVRFDNRLETASSQNIANYSITNAAGTVVAISSAARDATARGVVLRTSTPLAPDSTYTVTVANIRDETGTTTLEPSPTNATFNTLAFNAGSVMRELYPQFSGTQVDALVAAVRAGTVSPTKACLTNLFEYNDGDVGLQGTPPGGENYGGRIYGFFVPTTSGNHVFYLATDDPGRLFLSTDASPANVREIAREPVWSGRRTWVGEAGGGGRVGVPSASGGPQINISGPINLVAGQRYYIESFFTEGGGGDNMAVAVQGPGDPAPTAGSTPIAAVNLGVAFQAGSLAITTQPQSQTNTENGFVTFSAVVASSSVLCGGPSFQWYSNGVAVAGANGPSITLGPLSLSDNGAVYNVIVTSPERSVTSSNAILGVTGDTTPPRLLSASADVTFTNIFLTWSELMAQGPAIDSGNYLLLDSSGTQIFIDSAEYAGSNFVLRLQSPLVSGGVYSLEIDYQSDIAGNPPARVGNPSVDMTSGIVTNISAWVAGCPALLWESYPSGGGNAISVLTGHPSFPNNPDGRRLMATFDTRAELGTDNFREGFGARLRGLFVPPSSGNWVFYLHSDDAGEVSLNPNGADPAGKVKIVEETGCCRDWPAVASAGIPLTGGRAYYIEALYQEGTGGDYIRVAARRQGSTEPLAAIGPAQLGQFAPAGVAGTLTISQQPTNTSVPQNSLAVFTVGTQTQFPMNVCYQWQRNDGGGGFTNIPGAIASSYSLVGTSADNGAIFRVAATIVGATVLSSNATLTVVQDLIAPVLISARADQTFNRVRLLWSEVMGQTPAVDPGNYILRDSGGNQVTISSVDYSGSNVVLNLATPMVQSGVYTLEIDYQEDLVGNRTVRVGNPTVDANGVVTTVYSFVRGCGFVMKELYMGLSASTVNIGDLRSSPKYPNSPDIVRYGELLELNTFDEFEGYGARLRGWLVPPVSGNYTFYIAADDNGELWLSTDANPANIANIANEPVWSGRRTWVGEAGGGGRVGVASPSGGPQANISGPINLVAGQYYYFEALVKEGGGGDNLAVAWRLPGGPAPVNGSTPIEGKYIAALADPFGASVTITQQPASLTLFSPAGSAGVPLASVDFNANNGGFTVSTPQAYDGPWVYNSATGSWRQDGQQAENGHPNTSFLDSPVIPITTAGTVTLSFNHRYSFEQDSVNWDGGQVRVSVNGGPFTAIPGSAFTSGGFNGSVGPGSSSQLNGQQGFVGTSAGFTTPAFITSVANLGYFNPGDTVRVEFMAASDTNTRGPNTPNWEIDSGQLTQGGQLSVTLSAGATTATAPGVSNVVTYQWQRNVGGVWQDVFRPGANGPSFTFRPALGSVSDYRLLICVPGASATTAPATVVGLIVFPWNGPPQVLQRSPRIPGNWTDIPNAPNPFVVDPRGPGFLPMEFFRQKPGAP